VGETTARCPHANEEITSVTAGTIKTQIGSQRFSYVWEHGKTITIAALAPHDDLARSPVNVVELQVHNFAGAKA
jgi:hypothetical protein